MGAAANETRSGELLNKVYELHELLESEPICDTYRGTDRKRGRVVKVKLLRPEFALQSSVVEGFLRAPKALTGLRHPNLSQVLAVESDETGIPFVVEEHVEGEPLARAIERFPEGMPLGVAINLLSPIVDALAAAHERGVAHGRLDRDHVIVSQVGGSSVPKLERFGAAVARPAAKGRGVKQPAGAPELRDGKRVPDLRSDVWALGALLYQTLCGAAPEGSAGARPRLDERVPLVPAELAEIVERCLAEDPARRPARASDLRQVLKGLRDRMPGSETKLPAVQPKAAAPARAKPAKATGGALDPNSIALSATLIAPPAAAPKTVPREPRRLVQRAPSGEVIEFPRAESADLELVIEAEWSDPPSSPAATEEDDAPEIVIGPALNSRASARAFAAMPSNAPSIEVKTLSDVAAAFALIEQGHQLAQAAAPSTRSDEPAPAATAAAAKTRARDQPAKRDPGKAKPDKPLSPKQLREANAPPPRPLSDEQLRLLRERTQQRDRRLTRTLGALLFLLFAFLLVFAIPLLCDPTHTKAQALLGGRTQLAVAGFAIVSVFALVRTWALQIQTRPMLLRPVTITLKVVTGVVCVLAASFFLPQGALGPAEVGARAILPWGGSLFYLFLAMYGVASGVRRLSSSALSGVTVAMLYMAGFFGSYRVLATTVLAKQQPVASAQDQRALRRRGRLADVNKLAQITTGDLKAGEAPDGGAGDELLERGEVGASEQEDMRSIEKMSETRKRKGTELEALGKKMHKLIH